MENFDQSCFTCIVMLSLYHFQDTLLLYRSHVDNCNYVYLDNLKKFMSHAQARPDLNGSPCGLGLLLNIDNIHPFSHDLLVLPSNQTVVDTRSFAGNSHMCVGRNDFIGHE